jgi:hypothetical protein
MNINRIQFADLMERLTTSQGKAAMKKERLEIYFEEIKNYPYAVVSDAIQSIIRSDTNKTGINELGAILRACREIRASKYSEHTDGKIKGCIRCKGGQVWFVKDGYEYAGNCAVCHTGQKNSIQVFILQVDNQIFPAYRKDGSLFSADSHSRHPPIKNAIPRYTNSKLETMHNEQIQERRAA